MPPSSDRVSRASSVASRGHKATERWLATLTPEELAVLPYEWGFWARPDQLAPPGGWRGWLILTGRGWGKTRTAAEWVRDRVERGVAKRIALVNDTAADVRDVMVEGPSGLLAVSPPWNRPTYEPSKRAVTWPSGAVAKCYAAEAPELLRGPEHDTAWADEPAKWKNLRKRDVQGGTAWTNLMFGLRISASPQWLATTTPRGRIFVMDLLDRPNVHVTRGSSHDNRANLADDWYTEVIAPYEGTRLGRQEIEGEVLTDVPGALWSLAMIDGTRVSASDVPTLERVVVAVDPSGSDNPEADEVGIIAGGLGSNGHVYVQLDDTDHYTPDEWGKKAVAHYQTLRADRVVGEINFGGQMVEHTVRVAARDLGVLVAYKSITASRGKAVRAEPVSALYAQGRVHHVGSFPKLENEMTQWVPGMGMRSPNRMDALVWLVTELLVGLGLPVNGEVGGPAAPSRWGFAAPGDGANPAIVTSLGWDD
jgi:phage terminase large subunit-like protein